VQAPPPTASTPHISMAGHSGVAGHSVAQRVPETANLS
jgi:hypothetical protein